MSIQRIVTCDMCNKELDDTKDYNVYQTYGAIPRDEENDKTYSTFHLCPSCTNKLHKQLGQPEPYPTF